jgi:hypothetical protein
MTTGDIQAQELAIEELMKEMEEAPEPGSLGKGTAIHSATSEVPLSMSVSELQTAGYSYIYDRRNGAQSKTNNNMMQEQLEKRDETGARIYTTVKPDIEPAQGTLKCILHKDKPDREHYDAMGLATCNKANLTSEYQVNRHMQNRHPMEWATISEENERIERETERAFQRAMMEAVSRGAPSTTSLQGAASVICPQCQRVCKNARSLRTHVQMAHKEDNDAPSED